MPSVRSTAPIVHVANGHRHGAALAALHRAQSESALVAIIKRGARRALTLGALDPYVRARYRHLTPRCPADIAEACRAAEQLGPGSLYDEARLVLRWLRRHRARDFSEILETIKSGEGA